MMVWEIFGQFGLVWFGYYTNLLISCDICSQSKKFKLIMTQRAKGYHLWWFGKKKIRFGLVWRFYDLAYILWYMQPIWKIPTDYDSGDQGLSFVMVWKFVFEVWFGLAILLSAYILWYIQPIQKIPTDYDSGGQGLSFVMVWKKMAWFGLAIVRFSLHLSIYVANLKNLKWLGLFGPRAFICDGWENIWLVWICWVWFGDCRILLLSCDL